MSEKSTIAFTKMNGLGNDFVVIDARREPSALGSDDVRVLAARDNPHTKGCDQLLVLRPARNTGDVFMQIFNADGSEVEACGNGARAVATFMATQGACAGVIETLGGELRCNVPASPQAGFIHHPVVTMPPPRVAWDEIPLAEEMPDTSQVELHRDLPPAFLVNVGNPHAVIFVEAGTAGLAAQYGFQLERHRLLPEGANINFAACKGDNVIELDTWERGAGLTQACGTGACATAVAAFHLGKFENHNNEFRIEPPCARSQAAIDGQRQSGLKQDDLFEILVNYNGTDLTQQGPVAFEFEGEAVL